MIQNKQERDLVYRVRDAYRTRSRDCLEAEDEERMHALVHRELVRFERFAELEGREHWHQHLAPDGDSSYWSAKLSQGVGGVAPLAHLYVRPVFVHAELGRPGRRERIGWGWEVVWTETGEVVAEGQVLDQDNPDEDPQNLDRSTMAFVGALASRMARAFFDVRVPL